LIDYPKLTSDDVDKLIGNGSLPTAIVLHLQRRNHITRILLCVIHGITTRNDKQLAQAMNNISGIPSTDLASVTFDEGGIDGIRKRKLSQVFGNVILHLVCLEPS
jgi:hypothetical protein